MIQKSGNSNLRVSYDADADVLYMSLGIPKQCSGEIDDNGVIVKFDPQNNDKVFGITILDFQKRFSSPHPRSLPVQMKAELQAA
jgi:uncharacterized protein YuzE